MLGLPTAVIRQGFPKQTAVVDLVRHSGGSLCSEIEFLVKDIALSVALALAGFFLLLSNHVGLSCCVMSALAITGSSLFSVFAN